MTDSLTSVDVIVLGAGISGLTAAYEATEAGLSVVVVEASNRCGGAHHSHTIGDVSFDTGSFFFEETSPLFEMFPDLRSEFIPVKRRQKRIAPDGRIQAFPPAMTEVFSWSFSDQIKTVADFLRSRKVDATEYTVESMSVLRLGRTVYERSGLATYIERFNRAKPSTIGASFFHSRMNWILTHSTRRALLNRAFRVLFRCRPTPASATQLLVRPKSGFTTVYGAIQSTLESRNASFIFNSKPNSIERNGDTFIVHLPTGAIKANHVVSAIPIAALHETVVGVPADLKSLNLLTLFVCSAHRDEIEANVLFNFHGNGRWKRLTIHSDFYDPDASRSYFSVEITLSDDDHPNPEKEFEDFCRHAASLGVLPSDLTLAGFDVVKDAYPVYEIGSEEKLKSALAKIDAAGIISVGRQGRFDYLPVSSLVIKATRTQLNDTGLT